MEEMLFKWVPSVGFPIAVAAYLLMRVEPKLNALQDIIKELVAIVRVDMENSREVKNAITTFTLSINDLKNEISKISK